MNPITPNISHSYQNSPRTSSNTENAPVSRNHPTCPERKKAVDIIRMGLNNASTPVERPSKRLMYLLDLASTQKNPTNNIDPFLTLLDQIKDEELFGTKAEFIVENIIHHTSLKYDLRLRLATAILANTTDQDQIKAILLQTVKYRDKTWHLILPKQERRPISILLIDKAPEDLKPMLYKAFACNSALPLDVRMRNLYGRIDTSQKTELFKIFFKHLKALFKKIIKVGDDGFFQCCLKNFYGHTECSYLDSVMKAFHKHEWTQEPKLQELIKLMIERETEAILSASSLSVSAGFVVIQSCMQYYNGELNRKDIAKAAARMLTTQETLQCLIDEIEVYKNLGLINEEPMQKLLVQIGMNKCSEVDFKLEDDLKVIFVALKYIQDAEKKFQILNNIFEGELQETAFEDLEKLKNILERHSDSLSSEEFNIFYKKLEEFEESEALEESEESEELRESEE